MVWPCKQLQDCFVNPWFNMLVNGYLFESVSAGQGSCSFSARYTALTITEKDEPAVRSYICWLFRAHIHIGSLVSMQCITEPLIRFIIPDITPFAPARPTKVNLALYNCVSVLSVVQNGGQQHHFKSSPAHQFELQYMNAFVSIVGPSRMGRGFYPQNNFLLKNGELRSGTRRSSEIKLWKKIQTYNVIAAYFKKKTLRIKFLSRTRSELQLVIVALGSEFVTGVQHL